MNIRNRRNRKPARGEERIRLYARAQLATLDGKPLAPLACCTNISLGGLRVTAAQGIPPGTLVQIELQLPSGVLLKTRGRIAWLMTTLHPRLLSTPTGREDDACFGIAFDDPSSQILLPVARLFAARDAERRRARRIRLLNNLPIHA